MSDIELKPCPCCGGKVAMMYLSGVHVECLACGLRTPDRETVVFRGRGDFCAFNDPRLEVAGIWNRRVQDEQGDVLQFEG